MMLQALSYLDLGDNLLSGSLPQAWSNMANLEYFSLARNLLSGSMPTTWIASTAVRVLSSACTIFAVLTGTYTVGILKVAWESWRKNRPVERLGSLGQAKDIFFRLVKDTSLFTEKTCSLLRCLTERCCLRIKDTVSHRQS